MSSHFKPRRTPTIRRRAFAGSEVAWGGLQALEERGYMSASPVMPLEMGSSLGSANVLGSIAQSHSLTNAISDFSEVDVFGFDAVAGEKYTFDIDGDGGLNSYLRVFDSTGKAITRNDNGRGFGEVATKDSFLSVSIKASGRYYIGISSAGNTAYNLATGVGAKPGTTTGGYNLAIVNITPADTAGKTLLTARELGELAGDQSLTEFVGRYDTLDYFHFDMTQDSDFSLVLSGLSADADVRIIADRNNNKKIDRNEVVGVAAHAGAGDETLTGQLAAGSYYVEVKRRAGDTHYALDLSAAAVEADPEPQPTPDPEPTPEPTPDPTPTPTPPPAPVSDWFAQNLSDAGIISLSRTLFADGSLSRGDLMQILHVAGDDDGVVDAAELADLRLIVTNANTLGITAEVRVLAGKVVNAQTANAKYQGAALGNLAAGSADAQLDKLIDKWFLGSDRPNATIYGSTYTYRLASGSLFVNGASLTDIKQGYVGDCYLLATLGSIAMIDPTAITNMFIDNGDGTLTVRFFRNGVADYVTVDMYLPSDGSSRFIFANMGGSITSTGNELWVALAEKAYAQLNEAGWIGQDGTNSYSGIEGGWMETVYEQVLGRNSNSTYMPSQQALIDAFNAGKMVTLGSNSSTSSGVVAGHAYVLKNYNASTGTFDLYNPWATQHLTGITFATLSANFNWIATA
jgi:hypothetical protein